MTRPQDVLDTRTSCKYVLMGSKVFRSPARSTTFSAFSSCLFCDIRCTVGARLVNNTIQRACDLMECTKLPLLLMRSIRVLTECVCMLQD